MKPQKWEAELAVSRPTPDDPIAALEFDAGEPPFTAHISAKSLSSIDGFRRALQNYYGKDIEWDKILIRACRMAEEAYKSSPTDIDPTETELPDGSPHLIETVLPEGELSVMFGLGEAAKSLSALEMCMVMGSDYAKFGDYPSSWASTLWLDYENPNPKKLALRMNRLMFQDGDGEGERRFNQGAIRWMPGKGVPITELLPTVKRALARTHAKVLVVDSAAPACGGNAIDQEVATRTTNALLSLNKTVILIAHTTKTEDDRMPFGSAFWHYAIHGKSWFMKRVSEAESDEMTIGWYCKKVSDGRRPRDFAMRVTFDGERGPIRFMPGDLMAESELRGRTSLSQAIPSIVKRRPMLISELAEVLEMDADSVRRATHRLAERGVLHGVQEGKEKRWGLASNRS